MNATPTCVRLACDIVRDLLRDTAHPRHPVNPARGLVATAVATVTAVLTALALAVAVG